MSALKSNLRSAARVALFSVVLCGCAIAQSAQRFPHVEGESFAGQKIVLPDAMSGKIAVLIFGFSKASKDPTSAWGKRLSTDFKGQSGVDVDQLPALEDVPGLIRGLSFQASRKGRLRICAIISCRFCRVRTN